MAHSYINAKKNSNTERAVAVPDGALHLFMYFFNEVSSQTFSPGSTGSAIYEHYKIELQEVHTSYIDLMLQEVSEAPQLKSWYLLMLAQLELRLNDFGEYIDNNYLNKIPELLIGYEPNIAVFSRPVGISVLKDLINDIYWVLNEGDYVPSGQYKWFEVNT
jgi:hypothetical protein